MKILIKEEDIIPPQSLEHKVVIPVVIADAYPCNENGFRLKEVYSEKTKQVIVKYDGNVKGHIIYTRENFEDFKVRYNVQKPENLQGFLVLAVYEKKGRTYSANPTGLIHLDDKIEINREQ